MSKEPVAYLASDGSLFNTDLAYAYADQMNSMRDEEDGSFIDDEITVELLYTKEQLQPKVKMTQAEFDEFEHLYFYYPSIYNVLYHINKYPEDYPLLNKKLFSEYPNCTKSQSIFTNLHNNYDPNSPEETIEIVQEKKWFVRSKEKDNGVYYILGDISKYFSETTTAENDKEIVDFGHSFDTKEEAEKWVRPDEEAVLLEVEG